MYHWQFGFSRYAVPCRLMSLGNHQSDCHGLNCFKLKTKRTYGHFRCTQWSKRLSSILANCSELQCFLQFIRVIVSTISHSFAGSLHAKHSPVPQILANTGCYTTSRTLCFSDFFSVLFISFASVLSVYQCKKLLSLKHSVRAT